MSSVIEQMQADLDFVLGLDESAESVLHVRHGGEPVGGRMAIDDLGLSDSEWSGGTARIARAIMPKSQFTYAPEQQETIIREDGTHWIIATIESESRIDWSISLYTEARAK